MIRKNILITIAILLVLLLIVLLPVKLTTSIISNSKILPSKEWIISKGLEGLIYTTLVDNNNGFNEEYSITQFDRGDLVKFNLNKNVKPGLNVFANDTIGFIYSSLDEQEIADLKGKLESAKASLNVNISGEKESLIDLEKKNLDYAKKQVEEQTKYFDRQQKLFEKQLITQDEFETQHARLELYKINVSIAEERLNSVLSGTKKEEIQLINSQIKSFENQISVLQKKSNNFVLTSPIDGKVVPTYNKDTLLIINDEENFTALIPVKLVISNSFSLGNEIEIMSRSGKTVTCRINAVDKSVKLIGGEQYLIIKTSFKAEPDMFLAGEIVECRVSGNEVNLINYLKFYLMQ